MHVTSGQYNIDYSMSESAEEADPPPVGGVREAAVLSCERMDGWQEETMDDGGVGVVGFRFLGCFRRYIYVSAHVAKRGSDEKTRGRYSCSS